MEACMGLMAEVLRSLGRGEGLNPLRTLMRLPEGRGILGMMPGVSGSPEGLGIKVVTVFPGNHGTAYDAHQGVVLLFDPDHGFPVGILDASEVTAIRTAAVSGVATRLLAREDARALALVGAGVQARTHLEAMLLARPFRSVRIFSRSAERRELFAQRARQRHGVDVEAVSSAQEAVRGADVVCTVTSSREPVLKGAWIEAGTHVNAVGSSVKSSRELDTQAVVRSRLFVDRRESTVSEAGDYLFARDEGAVDERHILGEIGDLLLGRVEGRRSPDEVTLFESLGLAVEDVAAAHYTLAQARARGMGTAVRLGGLAEGG
jgi:ornithine cyclodeaminase/alanine dehydrogenase-like protein (mu-crystallin family)